MLDKNRAWKSKQKGRVEMILLTRRSGKVLHIFLVWLAMYNGGSCSDTLTTHL